MDAIESRPWERPILRPTLSIIGRAGGERARRLYSNDVLPAGDPAVSEKDRGWLGCEYYS